MSAKRTVPTKPMRDVMTIEQLADYLQIPKSTLYKLAQEGKVPGRKIGRQWRFHREVVDAWFAQEPAQVASEDAGRKT